MSNYYCLCTGSWEGRQWGQVFWEMNFDARDWVSVMVDLGVKISNVVAEGVTRGHRVFKKVNGNWRACGVVCEKGLVTRNTSFNMRNIHKYTYAIRKDRKWSLLDYIQTDRHAKEKQLDLNVLRYLIINWWFIFFGKVEMIWMSRQWLK